MKKIFTLLSCISLFSIVTVYAGTPAIDGVFDGTAVWGPARATGDGIEGWAGTNAKNFYVTWDDNYVYFGAECTADSWQQYIFAVNTKTGGGSSDAWGRTITYNYTDLPDFLFRGDIAGGNYSEFHVWNGTAWTGTGVNVNASGTEAKGTFDGSKNGFIEVRVPFAALGSISLIDAQFIITGNNSGTDNGHGCFDAVPNDNNCTSWNAPGNASVVSNYASGILLPLTLTNFTGVFKNGTINLSWKTATETNLKNFEIEKSSNGSYWAKAGTVAAKNSFTGANYTFSIENVKDKFLLLRLKMIDKDGQVSYSRVVTIKVNSSNVISLIGNPVTSVIKVAVNQEEAEKFQAVLYSPQGKKLAVANYQHAGGTGVIELSTAGIAPGLYLLQINSRGTNTAMKIVIQ